MLKEYNRRRRFDQTPEPRGVVGGGEGRAFVIQKHRASRLHYDFRLEIEGVLRSWAVPKGPSLDPQEKRLAIETEDHPLEYGNFEGMIPRGNYGAGQVIVWDRGTYDMVDPATPEEGWRQRKLHFVLHGEKLGGEWVLVKSGGRAEAARSKEWLFFKVRDGHASGDDVTVTRPESVLSGRTVEEVGASDAAGRVWDPGIEHELGRLGVRKGESVAVPVILSPMLATLSTRVPTDAGWLFEIKLDGVRAIAVKREHEVRIQSRNQKSLTRQFPSLVTALRELPVESAILDGEIVSYDEAGRSRFSLLQPRIHLSDPARVSHSERSTPAYFSAFDLLYINGYDLRQQSLVSRKAVLRKVIPEDGWIRYIDHIDSDGAEFYEAAAAHGLEGIVAKRGDSVYREGRSRAWLKIKTTHEDDFVVVGFTPPSATRRHLGALVLARYDQGRLVSVGRVGSGLDDRMIEDVHGALMKLVSETATLDPVPKDLGRVRWVRPELVAEVRFSEWTREGRLRAPVFVSMRDDKDPLECVGGPGGEFLVSSPEPPHSPVEDHGGAVGGRQLVLSNRDKVFWPDDGITKGDLIRYYQDIETILAPYLEDRPLVLKRYPDGIDGQYFFQKDAPDHIPDWVRTEAMWSEDSRREIRYIIGCAPGLLPYLANLGTITQNPWSSRVGQLEYPDYVIFDLDPAEDVPFSDVRKVALELGKVFEDLELRAYPKTSGASGIHVYLPILRGRFTWGEVRTFAEAIASVVVSRVPALATIERTVGRRGRTVYVDYLQNVRGKTVASVYSIRARAGAPVSTPLHWKELRRRIEPGQYNRKNIFRRLGQVGDLFRPVLEDRQDISPFLNALRGRTS